MSDNPQSNQEEPKPQSSSSQKPSFWTELKRRKGFKVISRTTMLRYGASDKTLPEIGKDLDSKYVVEGSVRRIGNHPRITIQLIDAINDHHIWASNFDRELVDIFATQTDLAREMSEKNETPHNNAAEKYQLS